MIESDRVRRLPDVDRVSVLVAVILLAYTLARFLDIPERDLAVQLPGIYLALKINSNSLVALLVAGLTATGVDWLLRDHPALQGRNLFQNWLLPALTAIVIGIPLSQLPYGPIWWVSLVAGGALLTLILVAEYISVDTGDVRQPLAAAGLTAVSFALYLFLTVTLRSTGIRLFILLPALALASWLVSLRAMYLRLTGQWTVFEAAIIALIVGQFAAALHYWPLTPIEYGMYVLGLTYALTSLMINLIEGKHIRRALLEPSLALILSLIVALMIR